MSETAPTSGPFISHFNMMNNRFLWVIFVPAALAAFVKTPRHTGKHASAASSHATTHVSLARGLQHTRAAAKMHENGADPGVAITGSSRMSTVQPPLLQSSKALQQGFIITSEGQEQTPNHLMHWHQLYLPAGSSTPQRCHPCLCSCESGCHSV